jgi:DNA-binding transcriptional regulator YiaG
METNMSEYKVIPYENGPWNVQLLVDFIVLRNEDVPERDELEKSFSIARLWRNERLTSEEIKYLVESSNISKDEFSKSLAVTSEIFESYIKGQKSMTLTEEKLLRIFLVRNMTVNDHEFDVFLNFIEWTLEKFNFSFHDISNPIIIYMKYTNTGWKEEIINSQE